MEISKIYKFTSEGMLKESIDYILTSMEEIKLDTEKRDEIYSTLILLSGKLMRIERDFILGIIEYEKSELFKARIAKGILSLVKDIAFDSKEIIDRNKFETTKYNENEIKSINNYFTSLFNSIGIENIKLDLNNKNSKEIEINIPAKLITVIIDKIERAYEEKSEKAYQVNPDVFIKNENLKKVLENIFTPKEVTILQALLKNYNSKEIAEKLGISILTLNWYRREILIKFKSIFKDEDVISTSSDVAKYLNKIGII